MADTFTTLLGARKQATGANENTWGDLLNDDVIDVFDLAIAGTATHAVTGGAVNLSADPMVEQAHIFSGVLVSDLTVTIPNLSKRMLVFNNTTGSYFMLVKTSAGTAVCIPQGTSKDIWCDGSNHVYRGDRERIGEYFYHAGTAVPAGAFECDGSAKSRTLTLDLFGVISTTHGVGNGATTYNLPDSYTAGKFLRSRTASVTAGTAQAGAIESHNHTAAGATSASIVIASNGAHTHTVNVTDPGHVHSSNYGGSAGAASAFTQSSTVISNTTGFMQTATTGITAAAISDGAHDHPGVITASTSVTVNANGGAETRPTNISAILCVRY